MYEFMVGSPWLTFFLAVGFVQVVGILCSYCINRPLRHMSIRKHGWPPAHCDADGDFKEEEDADTD